MGSNAEFTIHRMGRNDLELALEWATAEGWNPGLRDAECFYSADPDGFFVGRLDGEAIASISVVAYDEDFGFLGLYLVKPEFRGHGFGSKLWRHAIAYMGRRNIGLDGVVAQQDNYRRSGFHLAYNNIRYEGIGRSCGSSSVIDLAAVPFDMVCAYDHRMFPARRERFLRCWLDQAQGAAFGLMDGGRLVGYGVLRACRHGYKIGPLFADSTEMAEQLYLALAGRAVDAPLFLDTPETNHAATALATRHGMKRVFETARMYTRQAPALPLEKIFGVTSFELG